MSRKKISIVMGMYNSAKTIEPVINEIETEMNKLPEYEYEVVLVNDCGPDNVLSVAKGLAEKNKRIKIIDLAKNSGQTNAVMVGYQYATGDYIVEMDDDFQMPAYEIGHMVRELEEKDLDVVFAKYHEHKESKLRLFGSYVNSKMTEIMINKPKGITINSFFVMRKIVKDAMLEYQNNYPYLYGIIFATTSRVGNLEVDHRPRTNGKSNYTFKSLLGLWLNGFLNFSIKPLRIATTIGITIALLSFLFGIGLVLQRIFWGTDMVGWTSIVCVIIFFAGVQLIGIGIIGEYLGRLYISVSHLPRATVRDIINLEQDNNEE